MPTITEPHKQAPMEMTAHTVADPAKSLTTVTQQPIAEPRPQAEPQLTLRGGSANCGFTCCNGSCSFHKSCC